MAVRLCQSQHLVRCVFWRQLKTTQLDAREGDVRTAKGRHRRFVGGATAADDYGRLHDFFRPPRQVAFAGAALSRFLFRRVVPWAYFSLAFTNCTNIVVDNQNVITKVYFPRLILPVAAVFSGLVDFGSG